MSNCFIQHLDMKQVLYSQFVHCTTTTETLLENLSKMSEELKQNKKIYICQLAQNTVKNGMKFIQYNIKKNWSKQ